MSLNPLTKEKLKTGLRKKLDERDSLIGWTKVRTAYLGNPQRGGEVIVPREFGAPPGSLWVFETLDNNPAVNTALNRSSDIPYDNTGFGLAVQIGYPPGKGKKTLTIEGLGQQALALTGGATPGQISDKVNAVTKPGNIAPLKLVHEDGLTVAIESGWWRDQDTLRYVSRQGGIDLTSYKPSNSGEAKWIVVAYHADNGVTIIEGDPFTAAAGDSYTYIPSTGYGSAIVAGAVRLFSSHTALVPKYDFKDIRPIIDSGSPALGSTATLLHKLDATTAPTVNDDSGDGYSVGSVWIDTTNDKVYQCVDATATAAVWLELSGGGSYTAGLNLQLVGNEFSLNITDKSSSGFPHNHLGDEGQLSTDAIESGTLPVVRGGTGVSSVGVNTSVIYSDGSAFSNTGAADAVGQILGYETSYGVDWYYPHETLVETATFAGSTSSKTFTLPSYVTSNYTHLEFRFKVRSTYTSGGFDLMTIQFNSDSTSANYTFHYELITGATQSAAVSAGRTIAYVTTDNVANPSGVIGKGIIDLQFFGDSTMKTAKSQWDAFVGAWYKGDYTVNWYGASVTTSAITSVTLTLSSGNFTTNSEIQLYAIK